MTAVSVSDDFARFDAKSYAINKINSVEVRERRPHGIAAAVICGVLGVLLLIGSIGQIKSGTGGGVSILIGVALLALSYWQWQRSRVREYLLFLMTSWSETQAFVTRNETEVQSLRAEIEAAMVRHSQGGIRG